MDKKNASTTDRQQMMTLMMLLAAFNLSWAFLSERNPPLDPANEFLLPRNALPGLSGHGGTSQAALHSLHSAWLTPSGRSQKAIKRPSMPCACVCALGISTICRLTIKDHFVHPQNNQKNLFFVERMSTMRDFLPFTHIFYVIQPICLCSQFYLDFVFTV